MGAFERGTDNSEFQVGDTTRKPLLIGVIMLLIGLLAPVLLTFNNYGFSSEMRIQSILWSYSSGFIGSGFMIIPLQWMISMFPTLLFRFVPVLQIQRYYKGKTTRKRALLATLVGDGYYLFMGVPLIFISMLSGFSYFFIPLPFQVIFGVLVLWKFPIFEPTTPWESASDDPEPKSWWPKSPDSQQKKPDDDKVW